MNGYAQAGSAQGAYPGEALPPTQPGIGAGPYTALPAYGPQPDTAPTPPPVQQPMVVNNIVTPSVVPAMVVGQKSTGVAFVLTFFFGPFGLFYSSVTGGLIMTLIGIPFSVLTLGVGYFFVWVGSIIWGCVAADSHNKKMLMGAPVMAPTMSYMAPQPVMDQPMPVVPPQQWAPTAAPAYALPAGPVGSASETCPACASPMQQGTVFCTTCGARREEPVAPPSPVIQPDPAVVGTAARESASVVVPAPHETVIVSRCPNGHVTGDSKFCPECGAPLGD